MAAVVGSDDLSLPFGGEAKRQVRSGSTQQRTVGIKTFHGNARAKQSAKRLKTQHKETSFSEKLRLLGDMQSKKLPITLEASEEEVEEYMDVHGESLPFRWHYYSGTFFIDELNDAIHESFIQALSPQLSNAADDYDTLITSGADTCKAPESYGKNIEPDLCIRYTRKVPKENREKAADSLKRYYPSVVVEVGFSQDKDSLKQKIDAWFAAGDEITGVRCVVEISIDYQVPPTLVNYRLIRRGKRRPPYKKVVPDETDETGEHTLSIPAEDFFYPPQEPEGVQSIDIDIGVAYSKVLALAEVESESDEEEG